jgi:hypothetical protein
MTESITIKWQGSDDKHRYCNLELRDNSITIGTIIVDEDSKGFGDTVKKAIDKVTGGKVKQCGGCKKRQEALNKLMPYKGK